MDQETAQQMVQAIIQLSSLSPSEVISMITEIIIAIATIALLWGLFITRKAFLLQEKVAQANLFNAVSSRIDKLMDEPQISMNDEEKDDLYERIFAAFEHLADDRLVCLQALSVTEYK